MGKNKKVYKIIGIIVVSIMIGGVIAPPTIGLLGSTSPQMAYQDQLDELQKRYENDSEDYQALIDMARLKSSAANFYISEDNYNRAEKYLDKAIKNYQTALKLTDEDKIEILLEKSFLYYELGKYDESEEIMSRAYLLEPENPEVMHNYAVILFNIGKYQSAKEQFVKLSEHEEVSEEEKKAFAEYAEIIEVKLKQD
ncbi:tetratricopeptide repeat protein [Proteinivorax hydrogeniformans]|uniref:Tetratricopeptide repeat protein n=1 Tax=Proteinivorax hydrogeniformans TaxID=1826727 RepID=A0AAU8HR29_9FIRM